MPLISVPYDAADGLICRMRIGTDQASATSQTAGSSTHSFHISVSDSRRANGIIPRGLRLRRPIGSGADVGSKTSFIPIGTESAMEGYEVGGTITVGSTVWTITGFRPQEYN